MLYLKPWVELTKNLRNRYHKALPNLRINIRGFLWIADAPVLKEAQLQSTLSKMFEIYWSTSDYQE